MHLRLLFFSEWQVFFPRKAFSMELPPQPHPVAECMPKDEGASTSKGFVSGTLTVVKTADISKQPHGLQQKTDPETIPASSGSAQDLTGTFQDLPSGLPRYTPILPPQSVLPQRSSASAYSLQSRTPSGTAAQRRGLQGRTPSYSGPGGSGGSQYALGSASLSIIQSQDFSNLTIKSNYWCCRRLPGYKFSVSATQSHFDLPTAKEQVREWNEMLHKHIPKEYKPLPLGNLEE